jgi:hypothetical protein
MSNENNTAVVDDETGEQETEGRRSYVGYGLIAVAVVVLVIGTSQVLSANAEREAQLQRVRQAQSQMD